MSDIKLYWREIGESEWTETDNPAWFNYCAESAEHDTKTDPQ